MQHVQQPWSMHNYMGAMEKKEFKEIVGTYTVFPPHIRWCQHLKTLIMQLMNGVYISLTILFLLISDSRLFFFLASTCW